MISLSKTKLLRLTLRKDQPILKTKPKKELILKSTLLKTNHPTTHSIKIRTILIIPMFKK